MCQTSLSFGHITFTLDDNISEFTKEKLVELINCTVIKSQFSAFSLAQFLVRYSWVIKHLQTLCLKLSCLFEQIIIVDYEFSILLQSKTRYISRLNTENGPQCAVASTNLIIKTLSDTIEIRTSSGTPVLMHFYSLCPSNTTCEIFKNMSCLLSTLPQSENIIWKNVTEYARGLGRRKFRNTVLNRCSVSSQTETTQLFGSYATPLCI